MLTASGGSKLLIFVRERPTMTCRLIRPGRRASLCEQYAQVWGRLAGEGINAREGLWSACEAPTLQIVLDFGLAVGRGCTQPTTPTRSPSPSRTVDYAAIEAAIEDKISAGSLRLSTINAVLVSVGGETKVAHYRNGSKPQDALHVWSVTKSVVSALIGIAIDEKIISGLDATLPELLPRYQKYLSAEEQSITLRQLMSMTAGFLSDDPAPFENIHSVFEQRTDPIPMILKDGLDQPPGHGFSYSSRGSHLVSAVLREALVRADGDHPRTVLDTLGRNSLIRWRSTPRGREKRVLLAISPRPVDPFRLGTDAAGLHTACCLLRLRPAGCSGSVSSISVEASGTASDPAAGWVGRQ